MATSAFYTFDLMKMDANKLIQPILKSIEGKHEDLLNVIKISDALPNLVEGKKAKFDPATMLFVASLDWKEDGGLPEQLCKNNIRKNW